MPVEMSMMQAIFARESAAAGDASRVAEMAVAIWKDAGVALSPILGQFGVDALFKRSIYLAVRAHPFLASVVENKEQPDVLAALQVVLAQQPSTTAVAANIDLLQRFQDLLIALIGLSLTERLLRSVCDGPSSVPAEQDTVS